MRSPYFLSFYSVVAQSVEYASKNFPGQRIDFLFDIQPGQMEAAVGSWKRMREIAPANMEAIIGNVSFHDDQDVLPLQAADLSAGWTREQAEEACFGRESPEPPWGDKGGSLKCITRTWTVELYEDLMQKTGVFKMPKKIDV